MPTSLRPVSLSLLLTTLAVPGLAQCSNPWSAENAATGLNGEVYAVHRWDRDGAGPLPEVWVFAGVFTGAGPISANRIATFDPVTLTWAALGAGVNGLVNAMATMPNGDLVVGGEFTSAGGIPTNHIATWNGTTWATLGSGFAGTVYALNVRPSGTLVASAVVPPIGQVAEWNGSTWSALGAFGFGAGVRAFATTASGDLLATGAGLQLTAGGPNHWVIRWNGTSWVPFATAAVSQPFLSENYDLLVRANGDVVLCGNQVQLLGSGGSGVAIWNGTTWTVTNYSNLDMAYRACELTNGDLIVGGLSDGSVRRWTGTDWELLGVPGAFLVGDVRAMCPLPAGELLAAGKVNCGPRIANAGRWNGTAWLPVGEGGWTGGGWSVATVRPDGTLVASVTRGTTSYLGLRTASGWTSLGTATQVATLAACPNGDVIAGGVFTNIFGAGTVVGIGANRIARWNGTSWSPLGNGLGAVGGERVNALAVTPNGDVIAGGRFAVPHGGTPLNSIARWNGTSWSALGAGFNNEVSALAVMPNGDVVAAGYLDISTPLYVARWNGTSWQSLAPGLNNQVRDLGVRHDGSIVAGGPFSLPGALGPATPTGVAIWTAASGAWTGIGTLTGGTVQSLLTAANGDLVIGGTFAAYDGVACPGIARWNGSTWSGFGAGAPGVTDLALAPNGDVIVSGTFQQAGGLDSAHLALLSTTCPATVTPLGAGCTGAGGSPALTATSLPWLGATFRSRATGLPANSLAIEVLGYTSLSVPLAAILPQGVAGCMLTTAPDLLLLHLPNAGTVEMALPLAPSIVFAGFVLHQQVVALSLGPTFDIVALTSSNSLQLTEGWF